VKLIDQKELQEQKYMGGDGKILVFYPCEQGGKKNAEGKQSVQGVAKCRLSGVVKKKKKERRKKYQAGEDVGNWLKICSGEKTQTLCPTQRNRGLGTRKPPEVSFASKSSGVPKKSVLDQENFQKKKNINEVRAQRI